MDSYKRWLILIISFIGIEFAVSFINVDLSSYIRIFLWAVVACIVIIPLFFIIISIFEPKQAKFAYSYFKRYMKKLLNH